MNETKLVLVSGNCRQGRAVARRLVKSGFRVRVAARNCEQSAADNLNREGAEVIEGDLDHPATLKRAITGAYGIFLVQRADHHDRPIAAEEEVRRACSIVEAAKAARTRHLVYSSVGGADRHSGLPRIESKWRIEEFIRSLHVPSTILRPTFFMEEWLESYRDEIRRGDLSVPFDPSITLQQIAVEDIAAFAAMAFADPEHWINRTGELAGDELTLPQTAETLGQVRGRSVAYHHISWDECRRHEGSEKTDYYRWLNDIGYSADIPALRREHPSLMTLESYLKKSGNGSGEWE